MTRGEQLLQIVRSLDQEMNNTSVILLFQIGKKKLLFPGDAQIENWQFALQQKKYRSLLSSVNLYKVGHHGSRNATPKSLWKLFKNKSERKTSNRLLSLMSTMEGKHGDVHSHTEVPRETLVHELQREFRSIHNAATPGQAVFSRHRRNVLERAELWFDRHPALAFCLSMIFSENRSPVKNSEAIELSP